MKKLFILNLIFIFLLSCKSTNKLNGLYITDYSFGVNDLNSEPNLDLIIDLINSNYFEASVVYLSFKSNNTGLRYFKYVNSYYTVPFEYYKINDNTIKIIYNFNNIYNVNNETEDLLYYKFKNEETILKFDNNVKQWYFTIPLDGNLFVIYSLRKIKKI